MRLLFGRYASLRMKIDGTLHALRVENLVGEVDD